MKTSINVTSLAHSDIVDIFSTGLTGCDYLSVDNDDQFYADYEKCLKNPEDCFEDKIAKILNNGGSIKIIDMYAEGEIYSERGKLIDEDDDESDVVYTITIEDVLKGCSTIEGYKYATTLLVDEDGDYYTANNLLQIILFGEVIYG